MLGFLKGIIMLQIDNTNRIIIDGQCTKLAISQKREGTVIYTPESLSSNYKEHQMPFARYSTAHDEPHKVGEQYDPSVTAGRLQLEEDVLALIKSL